MNPFHRLLLVTAALTPEPQGAELVKRPRPRRRRLASDDEEMGRAQVRQAGEAARTSHGMNLNRLNSYGPPKTAKERKRREKSKEARKARRKNRRKK